MNTALKEWALVCELLLAGEQIALLRKGGIHEPHRGAFALEHDAFLLYPNSEHESPAQVQARFHGRLANRHLTQERASSEEAAPVVIPGFCHVTDVLPLRAAAQVRALEAHTCWTQAFFDMRLAYRPERPLYLVLVRAHRFPTPLSLPYRKSYAGCRSWVALDTAVDGPLLDDAVPALDDAQYERHRRQVLCAASAGHRTT